MRVTSPYTTRPTPRSFPFRTAIATDAPNSGDRTANHFAVFVPQPFRVIDKLAVRESHEVRTYTNFTSFRLSCGLRRSKNRETAGIFGTGCVIVIPSHATLSQLPLVRAAPRHPANASRPAKKFRVPLTVPELVKQKIAGPRASGVGSDFVIDDGTGKTLGMVVGVTE
ncbi:hypothetical protein ZB97_24660 [Salmonella enterica subsp. enterica serovar Typhimurium]|uniref:hypothetical protein n=10 Tax=Enterobacterales TaxID=91347 RepID=UPI00357106DE|nr:hypothetical protein [Salmonella enterica subsp. enterica serovar Typhimurium]ECN4164681.1 hypothetical protein [Salmonella enterica subsp. enterica serovar Typhimurium]